MHLMPKHAEHRVTETESGGAVLSVYWKLNNDPDRPNKYSKAIVIRLTRELLEDFPNYPKAMQATAVERIDSWIAEQLKTFDPDHTTPKWQHPPTVEWTIGSGVFA